MAKIPPPGQLYADSGAPLRHNQEAHDRPQYHYPSVQQPQKPTEAHLYHGKRHSEGQTTENTRVDGSFSSASGSTTLSYQKRQTPSPTSQWPSPTLEQTLVNSNSDRPYGGHSRHYSQRSATRVSHKHKRSEVTDQTSPALAYIRERRQLEEEDDYDEQEEDDHAIWVWFWLSVLDPLHSLASCIFTLVVAIGLLLALPIRLMRKRSSFGDQFIRTVAPLFKHHLEMMYAPSVGYAYEWDFKPAVLILIHLTSPLISIGVAVASWITGAFWVFTYIMGNPDGTERRDDGADAVLAVRNWWEGCLLQATRRRPKKPSMRSMV